MMYTEAVEKTNRAERKRGPKPGPPTEQYSLMLEPEPAEWAKGKQGGLSERVRRLLRDAYEREKREGARAC